jgi:hypothetical protein
MAERDESAGFVVFEKGWDESKRIAWVMVGWKRPPNDE